ncbi:hypothetical protein [Mucilaginibacter koreensis]
MLHQITWQQYLLLMTVALLIYYLIIWFRYYRKDPSRAAARSPAPQPTPASEQEPGNNDGLLGRPADDYGASTVDSEELIFGPGEEELEAFPDDEDPDDEEEADRQAAEVTPPVQVSRTDNDELLQGDMADLLEDIKLVFYFIKKHKPADRAGLVSRMAKKVELYPRVLESELLELVLEDICDKALSELGFQIGPAEIQEAIIYNRDSYQAGPFSKKGKW